MPRLVRTLLLALVLMSVAIQPGLAKTTLKVGHWFGDAGFADRFGAHAERFLEMYPDVEIELVNLSHSDYAAAVVVLAATGDTPDILLVPSEQAGALVGAGLLEDLDPWIARDTSLDRSMWLPGALSATVIDGMTFAVPAYVINYSYGYREDVFDERGLAHLSPSDVVTWDQIRENARRTVLDRDGDGTPDMYGYFQSGSFGDFATLMLQAGGNILDENKMIQLNTEAAREAGSWLWSLYFEDGTLAPAGSHINQIAENRYATFRIGSHNIAVARNAGIPVRVTGGIKNVQQGELPFVTTWAMSSQSSNKELAWEWLKHYTTPESQVAGMARGWVPMRRDVELPVETAEIITAFSNALMGAVEFPYHVHYPEINRMFNEQMGAVWRGEKALETTLVETEALINAQIGK